MNYRRSFLEICAFGRRAVRGALLVGLSSFLSTEAFGQNIRDGFDPGITNGVAAVAVQSDGRILVAGQFLHVAGVSRTNLARLNPDGSLDLSYVSAAKPVFSPSGWPAYASMTIQPDGMALIFGAYVNPSGQLFNGLIRLEADGRIDESFRPFSAVIEGNLAHRVGLQPDGRILFLDLSQNGGLVVRLNPDGSTNATYPTGFNAWNLVAQRDGRYLLAGGLWGENLRRFSPDGVRDLSFAPYVRWAPNVIEYTHISSLTVQPDGGVLICGWFSSVDSQPILGLPRIKRDGTLDTNALTGPMTGFVGAVDHYVMQPDGKILGITSQLRRHLPSGAIDRSFNYAWDTSRSFPRCAAVQPDGKILVGGMFTSTNGTPPKGLIRLYPDGTLDNDFVSSSVSVRALAIQPEGKLVVGSYGSSIEGDFMGNFLGRYGIDGRQDVAFQPAVNTNMHAICIQTDGKIAIAGQFYRVGGLERFYASKVNLTGTLDTNFNPGLSAGPLEWAMAVAQQDDGKSLIAGSFTSVGGQSHPKLARLQTNGNVDGTFSSAMFSPTNCVDCFAVRQVIIQPDGKLLVAGSFKFLNGGGRTNLVRLNSDGTLDVSFNPAVNGEMLALQRDGRLLVAHSETALVPSQLVRLNSNGSMDLSFTASVGGNVSAAAVQADGRIVVIAALNAPSGDEVVMRLNSNGSEDQTFAKVDDGFLFPDGIAFQTDGKILVHGPGGVRRLSNPTAALQSITFDPVANELVWRRSGSSPELERVVFESSADGTNYLMMGRGIPGSEGWHMTNATIPLFQNHYIRARGRVSTGWNNASSSLMESVVQFFVASPTELPRIVLTEKGNGRYPFLLFHFANSNNIPYGLLTTTNVALPEYQWRRLPPPEVDFFDPEGRYYFWDTATNAARFYRLSIP